MHAQYSMGVKFYSHWMVLFSLVLSIPSARYYAENPILNIFISLCDTGF